MEIAEQLLDRWSPPSVRLGPTRRAGRGTRLLATGRRTRRAPQSALDALGRGGAAVAATSGRRSPSIAPGSSRSSGATARLARRHRPGAAVVRDDQWRVPNCSSPARRSATSSASGRSACASRPSCSRTALSADRGSAPRRTCCRSGAAVASGCPSAPSTRRPRCRCSPELDDSIGLGNLYLNRGVERVEGVPGERRDRRLPGQLRAVPASRRRRRRGDRRQQPRRDAHPAGPDRAGGGAARTPGGCQSRPTTATASSAPSAVCPGSRPGSGDVERPRSCRPRPSPGSTRWRPTTTSSTRSAARRDTLAG